MADLKTSEPAPRSTSITVPNKAMKLEIAKALGAMDLVGKSLHLKLANHLLDGSHATIALDVQSAIQQSGKAAQQDLNFARTNVRQKQLFAILQQTDVPPGYYRRLGEFLAQLPHCFGSRFESEERLPNWFFHVIQFHGVVDRYSGPEDQNPFTLPRLFADAEDPSELAARAIDVCVNVTSNQYQHIGRHLRQVSGWLDILGKYPAHLAKSLSAASANAKDGALLWLADLKCDCAPILPTIVDMAVGSSKRVRALAGEAMVGHEAAAADHLIKKLQSGTATERGFAAEKIFVLQGNASEEILRTALANEKGKRVRQIIENCLQNMQHAEEPGAEAASDAPSLEDIRLPAPNLPLPEAFVEAFWSQWTQAFDRLEQQYQDARARFESVQDPAWSPYYKPQQPKRIERKAFDKIIRFVEGDLNERPRFDRKWLCEAVAQIPPWSQWADLRSINIQQVARLMSALEMVHANYYGMNLVEQWLEDHRNAQETPYDLRLVDAAFASLPDLEPGCVANAYLVQNSSWQTFLDWEPEAVWPLFVQFPEHFRKAILGAVDRYVVDTGKVALRVAAMMPRLPREIEEALWSLALGPQKSSRPAAQKALHRVNNPLPRVLNAIVDGKQDIRIAGAEMAGLLSDPAAVEPLKKALKKEKQELVKGAFLQAIEKLGGDVQEFLGREKQLEEAAKGLEKKWPAGMDWFPIDNLPTVRWSEDGEPVDEKIVKWWVVRSIKLKQPACGPVLKRSLDACHPSDRVALANFVLSAWISHDTRLPAHDDMVAKATKEAQRHWGSQWVQDYYKTIEAYRDSLLGQMQNEFLGSAIKEKGVLAVVAAAADTDGVKTIERYIRKYHGRRLAQSKALLETLAYIEAPSAVQVLLSLGNRFRTKAIRKRAEELVHELAERQGWTMAQLADRTIPDGGFTREQDELGSAVGDEVSLVLDYGSRTFRVVLNDELQPVITRDDGKQVKSLPAAAKADDPELVKVAKKEFSAAKKVVKEVVRLQAERFYEAACVQRSWPATEWKQYLASHPIVGPLCRRVVWAASPEDSQDTTSRLFRPLEDGSLTDVNDDELFLEDNDVIRLAHSSLLGDEVTDAWKQHLLDYEVPQLFRQFGRTTYRLPSELAEDTLIRDFEGHVLTTFRLRNRAKKSGWERGEAQDGGSFWLYHKAFRLQGIVAVMEFTGSYLPEEDIPAALKALYFEPLKPTGQEVQAWNPRPLRLEKVPPVLLSECYNDVREMAAEGSGFDPQWQRVGLW